MGIVIELTSEQCVGKSCSNPLLLQHQKDFSYALYSLSGVHAASRLEVRNFLEMYSRAALCASSGMSAISMCFPFHDVLQKVQKSYCQGFGKHVGFQRYKQDGIVWPWVVCNLDNNPPMELGPCHYRMFGFLNYIYVCVNIYRCGIRFQEWKASG